MNAFYIRCPRCKVKLVTTTSKTEDNPRLTCRKCHKQFNLKDNELTKEEFYSKD